MNHGIRRVASTHESPQTHTHTHYSTTPHPPRLTLQKLHFNPSSSSASDACLHHGVRKRLLLLLPRHTSMHTHYTSYIHTCILSRFSHRRFQSSNTLLLVPVVLLLHACSPGIAILRFGHSFFFLRLPFALQYKCSGARSACTRWRWHNVILHHPRACAFCEHTV